MQRTTVLIVGAGPTGLATAISLVNQGFRDLLIVDESNSKSIASRAMTIHAATLEALDTVGCAEPLVQLGIKASAMELRNRTAPFLGTDFSSLAPYTRFPYVLLLPQNITEEVLEAHLQDKGIFVLRPQRAVGLKNSSDGDVEVMFESGKVIKARYVIGSDGAKSVIRQMAGVGFADPDGLLIDESLVQIVLADVTFSSDNVNLPIDKVMATASAGKFFLIVPLPRSVKNASTDPVYRLGFNVPLSSGPPPPNPSISYLQEHLDQQGPIHLSSDPSINPNPIQISKIIWSTRFRTHAAIADNFLVRMNPSEPNASEQRGAILLVGDAAHIHAPAGGLGMNLGIRDAIALGPALVQHIASSQDSSINDIKILDDYVSSRRSHALATIRLTKRIMSIATIMGSTRLLDLNYWILRFIGRIPAVQRMMAWNLSGLGNM